MPQLAGKSLDIGKFLKLLSQTIFFDGLKSKVPCMDCLESHKKGLQGVQITAARVSSKEAGRQGGGV